MGGRPLEDAELVQRARRGDTAAYEELVMRHQGIAQRTAYLVTRSEADAQDVVQEAFVKAYRALNTFRTNELFRPWLLRIVTNEALNLARSRQRRLRLVDRVRATSPSGDAAPSPEGAFLDRERDVALFDAVASLPENDRVVIYYRYFLDLSEKEMAAALRCRPGTVKSRLSRSLGRLRARIDARAEGRLEERSR